MKKNCFIYWDDDEVPAAERRVYVQCEECYKKNKKGFFWSRKLLNGRHEIKCDLCDTIIYKREKKKKIKGDNEATI